MALCRLIVSNHQRKPNKMKPNILSSDPASNRYPYDLVDEMINSHLASIKQNDDDAPRDCLAGGAGPEAQETGDSK